MAKLENKKAASVKRISNQKREVDNLKAIIEKQRADNRDAQLEIKSLTAKVASLTTAAQS